VEPFTPYTGGQITAPVQSTGTSRFVQVPYYVAETLRDILAGLHGVRVTLRADGDDLLPLHVEMRWEAVSMALDVQAAEGVQA
jgi:hypothetical protein